MSKQAARVPCSHTTLAGRPCRAWAVRGSDPPACSSHSGASRPTRNARVQARWGRLLSVEGEEVPEAGLYGHTLSDAELADLVVYTSEPSLDSEIACTRIAVRRTLEFLNRPGDLLSQGDFLRAAGLVFQGARTIARLLREQQALTGGADSRLEAIFDAALDGLSEDWGIEL